MAVLHLTESRIRDLPLGSGIWRDDEVKGLLVVCHATTKTYAAQGDVRRGGRHVRTVRVKIDRVDRIGLREARNRARAIMSQIQSGVDPTAKPAESGITVLQALEEHLGEKPFRDATVESYRYNIECYLARYKNRAVADLSRAEVRDIYQNLRSSKGQTTATGVMRTLRAVINTAMRIDETLVSNPVAFIRLPVPRSRQVDELDLTEWWEKTEELSPTRDDRRRARDRQVVSRHASLHALVRHRGGRLVSQARAGDVEGLALEGRGAGLPPRQQPVHPLPSRRSRQLYPRRQAREAAAEAAQEQDCRAGREAGTGRRSSRTPCE